MKLNLMSIAACVLMSSCSSLMTTNLKTAYEQKRENTSYLAHAPVVYHSYNDLIEHEKAQCQQPRDKWEWDKVALNQNALVLEHFNGHDMTRSFANILCIDQTRPEEKILRLRHFLTNLTSSQEAREGIDKRGALPIVISVFTQDGKIMKTPQVKAALDETSRDWFVDFTSLEDKSYYVILEVDQSVSPDQALTTRSDSINGFKVGTTVFPISSGMIKAQWTSPESQSYRHSHSL